MTTISTLIRPVATEIRLFSIVFSPAADFFYVQAQIMPAA
jgi:hypothetical protein